jgi:hypothetical protein
MKQRATPERFPPTQIQCQPAQGWAEVYVSTNGRPEQLLAGGGTGSKAVKWIQAKKHYDFRLYEGKAHKKLLGEVEVTQQG